MTMVGSLGSPCPRELTILLTTVPDTFSASNDYHVLADGAPAFFRLVTQAIHDGVPFDGIGIQAHEPHTMRFPLRQVQTILDRYATLGKELRITEFTPASGGDPITESHVEGVWDEAAQADYAVKFYRVTVARTRSNGVIVTWYGPSKCLSDSAAALGLTTPMKNARAGRRQNPQVFSRRSGCA
ncbi:MAG: endo-1,4-beta-xylanase [Isosphaeraceae bacterium]